MRKLAFGLTLIVLASMFIPQHEVLADKYSAAIGVKQVIGNNIDTTYTGKHWADSKGNQQYEYIAQINQAPIYNTDGTPVDCSWHGTDGFYSIGNNIFAVQVKGASISTTYQGQTLSWNPIVLVDDKEYDAKGNPQVLSVDPINSNYHGNTLEWDYGICLRRVRVIEGMMQETWIFDKDPKGTVWIKDNAQKSAGFTWAIQPYAYDALDNPLVINQYKQVMASEFAKATYPVTIDPTEVYVTSASDGYMATSETVYATGQSASSATYIYKTLDTLQVGQNKNAIAKYDIYRTYLYFDTSALLDSCSITSSILSLRGSSDSSTRDFNISVQSGMVAGANHYPHDPLVNADFDKTFYDVNGIGNAGFNTSSFVFTGYNNISLNASGIAWIDKAGVTKLCIRALDDITATTPSTTAATVAVYSYEKGAGFQPTLYVTYSSSTVPSVTTVDATYLTTSSAQLNGYLSSDGGETCNTSFRYQPWYNTSWLKCVEFSINHSEVGATLTNFPVLVTGSQLNTTDPTFWSSVNFNGSDILFTASDGVTKLNREMVNFCASTWAMECYVNVTSVSSLSDTKFYMYYNNSAWNGSLGTGEPNSTATWDTNYIAVWHMNDINTSAVADSTVNGVTGFKTGAGQPAINSTNGISKSQYWDGSNYYINISTGLPATFNMTNPFTISGWFSTTNISPTQSYFIRTTGTNQTLACGLVSTTFRTNVVNLSGAYNGKSSTALAANTSYVFSWTLDNTSTQTLTVNGISQTGTNAYSSISSNVRTILGIRNNLTQLPWNGYMDEVRISNISRSASWINATYYSLMTPTVFAPVTDVFNSTSTVAHVTGDSLSGSATGLVPNTLCGFRVEAQNSKGTAYGSWLFFNTSPLAGMDCPTNVVCYPASDSISLGWAQGNASAHTYIRYKTGSYPTSLIDGNVLPLITGTSYTHTGLASGTSYYYRLWGESGGNYSTTNTTLMCTTIAGGATATTTPTPLPTTDITTWTAPPNGSALSTNPLYPLGNMEADVWHIPHNTWWFLVGMGGLVVCGLFVYTRTSNLLLSIASVIVFGVILANMGVIPMWTMYIFGLSGMGMSWKELR